MLLAACRELGGSPAKQDCLIFLENGWFNKDLSEDLQACPGQTGHEPRWKTLFAFARQDAVNDHECILSGDKGYWPISLCRKQEFEKHKRYLLEDDLRLRLMFMAKPRFKSYINPSYQPNELDLQRPAPIYQDDQRYVHHDIRRLLLQSL